jgi:NTE family protein
MGFGIAFSGGGVRGAAHVGVLCALEEERLFPSAVSGTSAGSIVAGLYALGVTGREMRAQVEKLAREGEKLADPDYPAIAGSLLELLTGKPAGLSGLLKGRRLTEYLKALTGGKNISQLSVRTVITAVDLRSRKTIAYTSDLKGVKPMRNVVWKTDVPLYTAMRASCAVPALFEPVETDDGMCLVDGGVTDVVPVDILIAAGVKDVLGVDVSDNAPLVGPANIVEVCNRSLSILMSCLSEYRASGEKLMITPAIPENAWILSFDQAVACMDAGYRETKKLMPVIKALFQPAV